MKVNEALVGPGPLKLMLLVVNWRHGPDRYHRFVPQLTTPVGYWPFKGRLNGVSPLKVIVVVPPLGGVGVGVRVGVGVLLTG